MWTALGSFPCLYFHKIRIPAQPLTVVPCTGVENLNQECRGSTNHLRDTKWGHLRSNKAHWELQGGSQDTCLGQSLFGVNVCAKAKVLQVSWLLLVFLRKVQHLLGSWNLGTNVTGERGEGQKVNQDN